jgi:hypothetical protein
MSGALYCPMCGSPRSQCRSCRSVVSNVHLRDSQCCDVEHKTFICASCYRAVTPKGALNAGKEIRFDRLRKRRYPG